MLVVKDKKKLLLNLNNPEKIISLVPGAKQIEIKGRQIVSVPHTNDTVRVLRNIGLKAPGPIRAHYTWPCRFESPFVHQYETAEFASLAPRAYILNGMGCIEGDALVRINRYGKSRELTLRQLHQEFHRLPDSAAWKCRSLMGDRFGLNPLLDVLAKGDKPTLRLTLEDGKSFRCTPDHRIARPDGTWTEAGDLVLGDALVVLPKQSRVASIEDGGVTDVYDLCMEGPHHNFVVNGVVVHNSGKTAAALWAFDYLKSVGEVDSCVVISPLSTLERAWGDEVFRHFPDMSCGVVHGDATRRLKIIAHGYDVLVTNHDGLKNKAVFDALLALPGKVLVIIDELAVFRNAGTDRWKTINTFVNGNKKLGIPRKDWVWGMTGTPTPNEPTDAWAQCRLITPGTVPAYFGAFRDQVMKQISEYKWSARETALSVVHRAMQPAIRFAREDCIDLPPTTYITREVPLTKEQAAMYKDMVSKFKAEYAGGQITALNEAVKIGKLLQIVCGVAYGPDGEMTIPAKPRTDAVLELIEQAGAKVIVFVPLTGALQALATAIGEHYGVAVVHGGVSKSQRDTIFSEFQSPHGPRVIVAQPGTMAHGLTLTAADTIIWYAPIHSAEIYQQANARIVRPGQKRNTLIARIQGSLMERKMYEKLELRGNTQGVLLDLFD